MQITLDEGYQFGLGVFETVALECGRPVFLDWHLERLGVSLKEQIGRASCRERV